MAEGAAGCSGEEEGGGVGAELSCFFFPHRSNIINDGIRKWDRKKLSP